MGFYQTAQICNNGHVITSNISAREELSPFCPKCGTQTITKCPHCQAFIRGEYEVPGVFCLRSTFITPSYCHACGNPYPWTEGVFNSISELLDLQDQLTMEEKEQFMSYLPIIFSETPQSEVTSLKLRILWNKLPSEIGALTKNILIEVISESIKKILFP